MAAIEAVIAAVRGVVAVEAVVQERIGAFAICPGVRSADESVRQAIVSRAVERLSEPIVRPARIRGQAREASVANAIARR